MRRMDLAILIGLMAAGFPTAVLATRGTQEQAKVTACADHLSQLWKAQFAYLNDYGGTYKKFPTETGEDFWLKLLRTPKPLLNDSKCLACPVSGDKEGPGLCSYRGPRTNVNRFADGDAVGADKVGNHGPDRGGNVLGKHGGVDACSADDLKWIRAAETTTGREREKAADIQEPSTVDNPEYLSWASCKPGTFIVLKTTHKSPVEEFTQEVTVQLHSVDKDRVRLLRKIVHRQKDADREGKLEESIPARISGGVRASEEALGNEDVEVDGTKISCARTRWSMTVAGQTTTITMWKSREVPGLLVLSRLHQEARGQEAHGETRLIRRGWAAVEALPEKPKPAGTLLSERKLCALPEGAEGRHYAFGRGGCSVAFVARKGEREFVVHDGKAGPEFLHVAPPCLSANGKTLAYGGNPEEGKFSLIIGSKRWDDLKSFGAEILLTPDGEHHLAAVETAEGWKVSVDGKAGPAAKQYPLLRFLSADGGYGYVQPTDDGERLVLNGVVKETGEVAGLAVGTGGTSAYALDGDDESGTWHNGRKVQEDSLDVVSIALSSDGKILGLLRKLGGRTWLHLAERRIEIPKKAGWLRLSADGSRAGIHVWDEGTKSYSPGAIDDRGTLLTEPGATRVILDPELAWLKEGKERTTAVVGGREIELPDYAGGFELTSEGIGYGAVVKGAVVWRVVQR